MTPETFFAVLVTVIEPGMTGALIDGTLRFGAAIGSDDSAA